MNWFNAHFVYHRMCFNSNHNSNIVRICQKRIFHNRLNSTQRKLRQSCNTWWMQQHFILGKRFAVCSWQIPSHWCQCYCLQFQKPVRFFMFGRKKRLFLWKPSASSPNKERNDVVHNTQFLVLPNLKNRKDFVKIGTDIDFHIASKLFDCSQKRLNM